MQTITYKNIPDYIASFPAGIQTKLQQIYQAIKKAAPQTTEAIKYGMPTFVANKNLVHFA
jgi:ribonuclease Z